MKIIKTREFLHLDPKANHEYREAISIVQTYGGYQMFYDIENVEDGDTVRHAFLNRTIMSLAEAEEVLKIKSEGFAGMGYTEVSKINAAPTADAQEIVYCKNCKYKEGSFCVYNELRVYDKDFCSRGVKMDNNEERSVQK